MTHTSPACFPKRNRELPSVRRQARVFRHFASSVAWSNEKKVGNRQREQSFATSSSTREFRILRVWTSAKLAVKTNTCWAPSKRGRNRARKSMTV